MSVEYRADASRTQPIASEVLNEIIIAPDSDLPYLRKTEKESSSCVPDRKQLRRVHPKKRDKIGVRSSTKENHGSGLPDDSLDGNPLVGTTLE